MTRRRPCVAIDGPVASGKSTIARLVAQALGATYVDSGAMYRALAWAALRQGTGAEDQTRILDLLREVAIELRPRPDGRNDVIVDGREVTREIRSQEVGQLASRLSTMSPVRRRLVAVQREMAREGGVVMEGRDIQTVVLPDAEVKIFLTAPVEERARRRWQELHERGSSATIEEIAAEIRARDERDSTREDSPLQPAPDAVRVDTGGLTIEQVVERVLSVAREKTAESD